MLKIVLRNIQSQLKKRLFLLILVTLSSAAIFVINSVLLESQRGIEQGLRRSVSGDASLSVGDRFTLFGSDLPLVSDYIDPVPLPDLSGLYPLISNVDGIGMVLPITSGFGFLELGDNRKPMVLLGADIDRYFDFFSGLEVIEFDGTPSPGARVALSLSLKRQIERDFDTQITIGSELLASVYSNDSFTLRPVILSHVFDNKFPVSTNVPFAIIDYETADDLFGYRIDDTSGGTLLEEGSELSLLDQIASSFNTDEIVSTEPRRVVDGDQEIAHFLLLQLTPEFNPDQLRTAINLAFPDEGIALRDWSATVGGFTQFVSFLYIVINIAFLLVVTLIVTTLVNSFVLSVFDRIKQIGTIRALGGQRSLSIRLIALENSFVLGLAGIFGLLIGVFIIGIVSIDGIVLENSILQSLFGASVLHPRIESSYLLVHMFLIAVTAAVSVVYPAIVTFRISPKNAMDDVI